MTRYRICKYEDAYKKGYCAQAKGWWSLGFWLTVKNIQDDVIVKSTPEEIKKLIPYWEDRKKITPIKQ